MKIKKFLFTTEFSLNARTIYVAGIPVFKIYNCPKSYYKKQKIQICGIKFIYRSKSWLEKMNQENAALNKRNLSFDVPEHKHNILFIAAHFNRVGGIETRILQYSKMLIKAGWNVFILSEKNENEELSRLPNLYLNFEADNINECLKEIIEKCHIKVLEFQFKKTKILKKLDFAQLKNTVKTGCVIHNLGVQDKKIINDFDYKILVSRYMYENYYNDIRDADVISNAIDTTKDNINIWKFNNQKTALLISRISSDKMKSVECFVKYCQKNNMNFKIAGDDKNSDPMKMKLIKKFNLSPKSFIGQIDTLAYLNNHADDILFVGGVGQVILESLFLGYPAFCCSDYAGGDYSFVTAENIALFDNFTVRKQSKVSKLHKKVLFLDVDNISKYCCRDFIIKHRDLYKNFECYLNILNRI